MKKFHLVLIALCALLFSVQAQSGMTLGEMGQAVPNPDAQPNSSAFGNSLDEWIEAYLRWLEDGADPDARVNNVAFLPIIGESPFNVEVKAGTALVLPIALYLGFPGDEPLDPSELFGEVFVDGQPVAVPNEDYYVEMDLEPNVFLFGVFEIDFFQGLGVVIKPLTPGMHTIDLFSIVGDDEFTNSWNITVAPPGKK